MSVTILYELSWILMNHRDLSRMIQLLHFDQAFVEYLIRNLTERRPPVRFWIDIIVLLMSG